MVMSLYGCYETINYTNNQSINQPTKVLSSLLIKYIYVILIILKDLMLHRMILHVIEFLRNISNSCDIKHENVNYE